MNRYAACLLLLILLAACTSTATSPTQPTSPATITMTMPQVTDTPTTSPTIKPSATVRPTTQADLHAFEQNRRLGRGINLGNALEAPNEGEWGVTLEADYFMVIKEGGFDSVRVPIRWSAHSLEVAPYTIDEAFFKRVDWVLEQAKKNDLAVILNMHHYDALMSAPGEQKERFLALWQQIAERYQDQPDSVYFELLNEPNGKISTSGAWNEIAAEGVTLVRQTNPARTLIIGPGNWNNLTQLRYLKLPEEDRNIIVTFHDYSPFQFTHQGAEWVQNADAWMGTQWEGTEADQSTLRQELEIAARWSVKNNRPLFMGEFGAYSKADLESRHRWTAYMVKAAEERGFSWAYWEFCSGFGAYDAAKQAWNEPIYSALMP